MRGLTYTIAADVFTRFPGYTRGVVLAYDVTNGPAPAELVAMLRTEEAALRSRLSLENLAEEPHLASWRQAFRQMGAKPSEFRPSIEALLRRVLHDQDLPTINALVDIGTLISLRHLAPTGSHAIDILTQDITLRPATGAEDFVPFGSDQIEHPTPGEIIFVEGNTVLTRRWTWRQSNHTLTLPASSAVEINIDGLPPVSLAQVDDICREVVDLTQRFCGGTVSYEILTQQHPSLTL